MPGYTGLQGRAAPLGVGLVAWEWSNPTGMCGSRKKARLALHTVVVGARVFFFLELLRK